MSIDEVMQFVERVSHYDPARPQDLSRLRAAIERHVAGAVAREQEECARVCEILDYPGPGGEYRHGHRDGIVDCAAAIRARGTT